MIVPINLTPIAVFNESNMIILGTVRSGTGRINANTIIPNHNPLPLNEYLDKANPVVA